MRVSGRVYAQAITGLIERKEYWYEEFLMCNINHDQWERKQMKYNNKLVKIQRARIATLASFNIN